MGGALDMIPQVNVLLGGLNFNDKKRSHSADPQFHNANLSQIKNSVLCSTRLATAQSLTGKRHLCASCLHDTAQHSTISHDLQL